MQKAKPADVQDQGKKISEQPVGSVCDLQSKDEVKQLMSITIIPLGITQKTPRFLFGHE